MSDDPSRTQSDLTLQRVGERLQTIRDRISRAGGIGVSVLPVTKTFPVEACEIALALGCTAVGENYAQEVVRKLAGREGTIPVRFIGQLQSNKVRSLVPFVEVFETVDRPSLVDEIARRSPGARILLQVDTAHERGKGGCPPEGIRELADHARGVGLRVEGLMTVGPTEGGPEDARPGFQRVRRLCTELGLEVCSMGMSDDLEVAVQEGSTEVRVGSALFGARPPR